MQRSILPLLAARGPAGCLRRRPGPRAPRARPAAAVVGDWVLTGGSIDGGDAPVLEDHRITMTIAGSRVGGTAACNSYGGEIVDASGRPASRQPGPDRDGVRGARGDGRRGRLSWPRWDASGRSRGDGAELVATRRRGRAAIRAPCAAAHRRAGRHELGARHACSLATSRRPRWATRPRSSSNDDGTFIGIDRLPNVLPANGRSRATRSWRHRWRMDDTTCPGELSWPGPARRERHRRRIRPDHRGQPPDADGSGRRRPRLPSRVNEPGWCTLRP